MKPYFKLILLFILAGSASKSFADDIVNFKNVWLEHDVKRDNAICMGIHVKFSVDDNKGKKVDVGVLFKDENGNFLQDINNRYTDSQGLVWVCSTSGKCTYTSSLFNDYTIYIPTSEIHGKKGKHNYTAVVYVKAKGTWYKSPITASFSLNQQYDYERCYACQGDGYKTCTTCNNLGMTLQVVQNRFPPYNYSRTYASCQICGGKKKINCVSCSGNGYKVKYETNYNSYANSNNYGSSYNGSNNYNYVQETPKTREVPCTECNATGLVVKKNNFGDACQCSNGSPLAITCYNKTKCYTCQQIHCPGIASHETCHNCKGVRTITEEYRNGSWYRKY